MRTSIFCEPPFLRDLDGNNLHLEVLVVRIEAVGGAVERLGETLVRLVPRQLVERPLLRRPLRPHVVRVREAQSVAAAY